jgi:hypothetical protein
VTWFILFVGLIGLLAFARGSMDFQEKCEKKCGSLSFITPTINFEETCYCEVDHGKWARTEIEE